MRLIILGLWAFSFMLNADNSIAEKLSESMESIDAKATETVTSPEHDLASVPEQFKTAEIKADRDL